MIKIKNEMFNNVEFLETVKKIYRTELPAKDSYRLMKILKALNERSREYDEIKNKVVNECGYETEEGQWKFKTDEDFQRFQTQFNELLDIDVELFTDKIPCPNGLVLSPFEMELMEDILDYGELDD